MFELRQDTRNSSPLLPAIVAICAAYAFVLVLFGMLSLAHRSSFTAGALLLGSGLEVMGPAPYFVFSFLFGASALGLSRRRNWARRVVIALCAVGAVLLVPAISSAVVDERWWWMLLLWLDLLPRVVIATVLWRERDAFDSLA